MTPEEKNRLDKLEKLVFSMVRGESLELVKNLERQMNFTLIQTSSKAQDSEDVTIDEAGVSTKVALDDPDGWIKVGPNKNIPIYND